MGAHVEGEYMNFLMPRESLRAAVVVTGDDGSDVVRDLEEMSLEDFLQEEVVPPPLTQDHDGPLPGPRRHNHGPYKPRCGGRRGRGGGGGGRYEGSILPNPPRRRDGVKVGVMMTHNSLRGRPHSPRTPPSLPQDSVVAVGSRHTHSVKGEAGLVGAGVSLDTKEEEAAVPKTNVQTQRLTFVLGQALPVSPGQHCHFLPVSDDLGDVRRDTILKLVVGMLNGGGRSGVVYLGVASDGRVKGIAGDSPAIATFVEGLVKTLQFYLLPRLHAPSCGVRCDNVVTAGGQLLNNVWVVEVHAWPREEHYYNAMTDMTYRVRHGTETKSLPFATFCHAVVASASRPFQEELAGLEEGVRLLKEALEEGGVDTSSVEPHACDRCWFNDCPVKCYGRPVAPLHSLGGGPVNQWGTTLPPEGNGRRGSR